ncbi:SPOR domain-containing protein [Flammeovirga sp. EKP202]|uniref:SPOR domain-containing protein n=1 Tax=Flammeovirga sp. EKP202 TaxID=2770592 RepID=UPI00165EE969|nr:SPOR domain-containing protein [Flammeovirga sp. EKP202]MBD0405152.1 SPOR domain-containing protein [Flammeovirga sp. EKP202]
MKYRFSYFFILLISSLTFFSCSVEQFDEEKPFSIKISSFREYDDAERAFDRIKDLGIKPYMITQNSSENGKWFHIMAGTEKSLEDILSLKMNIEDDFRLTGLEIQNYNKIAKELYPVKDDGDIENYPVTWPSLDLIAQLPFSSSHVLTDVKSLHYYNDISHRHNKISKNIEFDLPRGLSIKMFNKNVEEIAEARYLDPVYKDEVVVHIIKLHEKHKMGEEVAKMIAEKIMTSRKYNIQKMDFYESNNNWDMKGYAVTINPKELKSYLVQESGSGLLIALFQSTNNDINLLKGLASKIGEDKSIENYHSIGRILGALPDNVGSTERLVAFKFETKKSLRGKTALLEVKETNADFLFNDSAKGTIVYQFENFNDQSVTDRIFKKRYSTYINDSKVEKFLVGSRDAFIYKIRRRNPETRRIAYMAESIIFQNDRLIGKVSNYRDGFYSDAELINKLSSLRLGDDFQLSEPNNVL